MSSHNDKSAVLDSFSLMTLFAEKKDKKNYPIYTPDKAWTSLQLSYNIVLIH